MYKDFLFGFLIIERFFSGRLRQVFSWISPTVDGYFETCGSKNEPLLNCTVNPMEIFIEGDMTTMKKIFNC